MPDIFDQIGGGKGDVFDQVAPAPRPQPSTAQIAAQRLTRGLISPSGLSPAPPLKPAMEAAGARHMLNEERLGQYEDFAAHSPTPVSNASLLYSAVELPKMLNRGAELISKPFSRLSLANEWKVPGLPIKVNLKAPPLTDRLGNELNIPGIESEMQTDIAAGQQERAAAHAQMQSEITKGQLQRAAARNEMLKALPEPQPELGSPENPGWTSKLSNRMPKLPEPQPELGSPENPGWTSKLSNRMPKLPATAPIQPRFLREIPRQGLALPGPEGEGPIGSNPIERRIQTTASKAVVTPEEYAQSVRDLGSRARMLPGEGEAEWRARVTGLLKAARGRTK